MLFCTSCFILASLFSLSASCCVSTSHFACACAKLASAALSSSVLLARSVATCARRDFSSDVSALLFFCFWFSFDRAEKFATCTFKLSFIFTTSALNLTRSAGWLVICAAMAALEACASFRLVSASCRLADSSSILPRSSRTSASWLPGSTTPLSLPDWDLLLLSAVAVCKSSSNSLSLLWRPEFELMASLSSCCSLTTTWLSP
mmetsp:Transcript_51195/g.100296  ORF Transcript_51195/g.100296 Transcript_51195/m.100296 type:complete len:204 (+) Transcript_51195:284-895(+)